MPTTESIVTWCRQYLAGVLEVPVETIDPDTEFDRLGIDSAIAVALLTELEARYDVSLAPEALYEHPTLTALAAHLRTQAGQSVASL